MTRRLLFLVVAVVALLVLLFAARCARDVEAPFTAAPTAVEEAPPPLPQEVVEALDEETPLADAPLADDDGLEDGAVAEGTAVAKTDVPAPSLFDVPWSDRSPFAANLVNGAEGVLDELPGASVYHIALELSDSLTDISGRQEVLYTNREAVALDEIVFRLFPNISDGEARADTVSVNGEPVQPRFELAESAMIVPLSDPLQPGEAVVISIDFIVRVPERPGGNYGIFAFQNDVLALAHFYPLIAVYDDEGWNAEIPPPSGDVVFAESSFYLVQVSAPAELVLAASGSRISEDQTAGVQTVIYAAGPVRDFYVVGSPRFEIQTTQVGETVISSYTFPEFAAASAQALEVAAQSLETFNAAIGIYPFTELDIASTSTLALGVEYPAIVVVTDRLYNPESDPWPPEVLISTVAHEVAHQWFYSIIGNDQLDEPWLDESLTQYATLLYWRDHWGEAGADAFLMGLRRRWAAAEDETMPIGLPVEAYTGPAYSAIVYGRGPLFFVELEETMGATTFADFLRAYYVAYQWEIVRPPDLQALAEATCECELDALFEEWVYP